MTTEQVHTFSNGTEADLFFERNCLRCTRDGTGPDHYPTCPIQRGLVDSNMADPAIARRAGFFSRPTPAHIPVCTERELTAEAIVSDIRRQRDAANGVAVLMRLYHEISAVAADFGRAAEYVKDRHEENMGELAAFEGDPMGEDSPVNVELLLAHTNAEAAQRRLKEAWPLFERVRQKLDRNPVHPTVVCLCGSTRFGAAFAAANLQETLTGKIVLSIGCNLRSDAEIFGHLSPAEIDAIKQRLDDLHLRKIDMADEVLILNVGGYVGESTRRELAYAREHGKVVRWLEPDKAVQS